MMSGDDYFINYWIIRSVKCPPLFPHHVVLTLHALSNQRDLNENPHKSGKHQTFIQEAGKRICDVMWSQIQIVVRVLRPSANWSIDWLFQCCIHYKLLTYRGSSLWKWALLAKDYHILSWFPLCHHHVVWHHVPPADLHWVQHASSYHTSFYTVHFIFGCILPGYRFY